mmetsp:Transcript_39083/g.94532  ORF Transcript_39083/g.94532 Transcript_39083/m.94532 type:complete len:615 (-) Transcript_39083:77-1921(-)
MKNNSQSIEAIWLHRCVLLLVVAAVTAGVVNCYSPIARGGRSNIFRLPQTTSTGSPAATGNFGSVADPFASGFQQQQTNYNNYNNFNGGSFPPSPPQIPSLSSGMGVQSNVGGSRDDVYYQHQSNGYASSSAEHLSSIVGTQRRDGRGDFGGYNDPNGSVGGRYGAIQIRGSPNVQEVRRRDVPPTSPGLFSKGVLTPSPSSMQHQQDFYDQQYNSQMNYQQKVQISQTGSNVRGSSLPPSSDVPPTSPGLFSRGVLTPDYSSNNNFYSLPPPRQERVSIKETGHDVTAVNRAYPPRRNHHVPQRYTNPFKQFYLQHSHGDAARSNDITGYAYQQQRSYSSPPTQQQQAYFPSPSSSLNNNPNRDMSNQYDTNREFAFDQQQQQQQHPARTHSNNKQMYNQLQDSWNKQIQKYLDASHLYVQASVWLHNTGYEGMSSYAVTRSTTLRNTALQLIELGYEASNALSQFGSPMGGDCNIKIKVPQGLASGSSSSSTTASPAASFTNGFQRKKSFKEIMDVWQQLVSTEGDVSALQQQLLSKMVSTSAVDGSTNYLISPTYVSSAQTILNGQIQLEQSMVGIAEYVNQVQYDPMLLQQYDVQFALSTSPSGGSSVRR